MYFFHNTFLQYALKYCYVKKISLLPLEILKLINLVCEERQASFEISSIIFCLEDTENCCIFFAVWIFRVANLKTGFKRFPTMITPYLDMDFILHLRVVNNFLFTKILNTWFSVVQRKHSKIFDFVKII